MCLIMIQFNKNDTRLLANSIFGNFEILNKIDEVDNHYKIVKSFFPNFDENYQYNNFEVFPYFNNNFKLNGSNKNIKIIYDSEKKYNNEIKINEDDKKSQKLIYNDFLKLFKNNIPYGIFFIYEVKNILYMITTTYDNNIVIINKSNTLDNLFNKKLYGRNIFNFQPLSEQGIKFIYYNDKITGVVNGIGKI